MSRFTTILFDLDDTLFDFSACWKKGMEQTVAAHPLTADLDKNRMLEALERHGDDLWIDVIAQRYDFTQYRRLRLQRSLADFGLEAAVEQLDDFQSSYAAACMEAVTPNSSDQAVIAKLAERFTLGIVTNGPVDMAFIKLDRLGLSEYFPKERVFISELIGYHKPDKRIYAAVLNRLGADAKQVLFVGDTWEADVAGAMDAGMAAVWINPRGKKPDTDHEPLAVIERLDQLLALVT